MLEALQLGVKTMVRENSCITIQNVGTFYHVQY